MAVPLAPTAGEPIAEAWGDVVHDAVVAQDIQTGYADVAVTGTGVSVNITFPRPFASAPIVVVSGTNAVAQDLVAKVAYNPYPSATGFTAVVQSATLATHTGTVRAFWIAYGPRA